MVSLLLITFLLRDVKAVTDLYVILDDLSLEEEQEELEEEKDPISDEEDIFVLYE